MKRWTNCCQEGETGRTGWGNGRGRGRSRLAVAGEEAEQGVLSTAAAGGWRGGRGGRKGRGEWADGSGSEAR